MKFESRLGKADMTGTSTRTIVPKRVIEILDLEFGDKIVWNVEFLGKDEFKICVTPKKHYTLKTI